MDFEETEGIYQGRLTAKKVQDIYRKHGETITEEEAEFILRFARKFANVAVAISLETQTGRGFQ